MQQGEMTRHNGDGRREKDEEEKKNQEQEVL